ncbi:hypothetical protein [Methylocystis parvus]|uniref:MaoC family dehydratase n=1 Tax=Methylocystis parvus TaxID=134 RepID=A0A6B8M2C4_9HYPH|nr:hypothetical protein [Methylocystis parvus]QGM96465.1 hypothetical protein F7D14_02540 [Methylocystis parvus]WBJ99684.1 hypothetical protein MMG94_17090 [Methylocystis parvus OBBP]
MPPDAQSLGPFRLRVDPAQAEAYSRETGGDGSSVPLSFPAVWLTDATLFDPVRALCAALDVVPVQESQSFSYETPLVAGESYDVSVAMRREETPPRLVIDAIIATPGGASVATSETMLRLVPRTGFGGAS